MEIERSYHKVGRFRTPTSTMCRGIKIFPVGLISRQREIKGLVTGQRQRLAIAGVIDMYDNDSTRTKLHNKQK